MIRGRMNTVVKGTVMLRPISRAFFAIGVGLNAAYVLAEALCGFSVDSVALLADAGHNVGDVIGLLG